MRKIEKLKVTEKLDFVLNMNIIFHNSHFANEIKLIHTMKNSNGNFSLVIKNSFTLKEREIEKSMVSSF